MAFPALIPLIAAGISAAGSVASTAINASSQKKTNQMQISENEKAFARNQAEIRRQNIYNSPAQQLARLAAAGLNPQMAYGNGDIVSSTQNDVPTAVPASLNAPSVDLSGIPTAINAGLAVREQFNKNSLAKSLAALQDSQALVNTSVYELNKVDLDYLTDTLGFRKDIVKKNYEILVQEGEINDQTIERLKTENKIQYEVLSQEEWNSLIAEGRFDLLMVELGMKEEEFRQLRELYPAKLAFMNSEASLNWAKSKESSEVIGTFASIKHKNEADARLADARAREQRADTRAKDYDNNRRRKYSLESRHLGQKSYSVKFLGQSVTRSRQDYYDVTRGLIKSSMPESEPRGGTR